MRGTFASLVTALLLASASATWAADIKAVPVDTAKNQYALVISGDIAAGDHENFSKLAAQYDNALVILNSRGGSTIEAIDIGKIIRIREYTTVVFNNSSCDSACALIWLAGKTRYLESSARIGFHATYIEENGVAKESGSGNAIVGNYLSLFNLNQNAIFYLSSATPDSLNYVSLENSKQLGIGVEEVPPDNTKKEANSNSNDAIQYANFDNWTVRIDPSLGGGCFMYTGYQDGFAIRLGFDARNDAIPYLILFGTHWNSVQKGEKYDVSVQLGTNPMWSAAMTGVNLDGLKGLYTAFKDKEFFSEASKSKQISIFYKNKYIDGGLLTGSNEAVISLLKCEQEQENKRDPFRK
jgi:hypothetical protein